MLPQSERWITIVVTLEASNNKLLEGLDDWLRLGLISDVEVRQLCSQQLRCPILASTAAHQFAAGLEPIATALTPISNLPQSKSSRQSLLSATTNRTAQVIQSLMAEFSLMWLLFLGVFMVVVSSGVLAVSQWRQFPPEGQYLILLGYTLAFWLASAWTGQRERLRLTARMLKLTTLLIIPVNFWMLDGLKLWQSQVGLAIAVFAALLLTAIIIHSFKLSTSTNSSLNARHKLLVLVSVGLSWLHWGWSGGSPIVSTYIGTVGTAIAMFYLSQENTAIPDQNISNNQFSLGIITVTVSTLLLLVRAIFVAEVPVAQLGLALGLSGWLFCWLPRRNHNLARIGMSARVLSISGVVLLLAGWFVSANTVPWQAIAVSGLALWLLVERLRQRWQIIDLIAIFLVGLQLFWLLWRLIPTTLRQNLLTICIQIAGTTFMPWAIVGVALFPYVVVVLFVAARLRRWQQPTLANCAQLLALLLGIVLTGLSLANPLARSLNLLLSSLTLVFVTRKRTTVQVGLIYLTNITGLLAIASSIYLITPNLSSRGWSVIFLVGMVAEWIFSIGSGWQSWRRSAWHIGLGLAAIGYSLLLTAALASSDATWSLTGLTIPITLTAIASHPQFLPRRLASWLSVFGLFLIQLLTFTAATPRLTSLGIATILMLFNTRQLPQLPTAVCTIGFALAFGVATIWQVFAQYLSIHLFLSILALTSLSLWLLRQQLSKCNTTLSRIYTQASDGWAAIITSLNLLVLTIDVLLLYPSPTKAAGELLLAATLTITAIAYRTLTKSSNFGFYGSCWGLEILLAGVATLTAQPLLNLAIANLALGLTSQLLGDWWVRQSGQNFRSSWHVIPLIYAILGCLFQHGSFTTSTGLFTLGAALIGIGVSRRSSSFKFLTYFSLLGVSVAAYELLYQFLQGGSIAEQLVMLAGLGAVIAISECGLARWLVPYLRLTNSELHLVANLHWASSSVLIGLALLSSVNFGGVLVVAILGSYALYQGRTVAANSTLEALTYAGIVEGVTAISLLLHLAYPDAEWLVAWSAAIACIFAYGMYALPWHTWGWSSRPWRQSAYVVPIFFICISIGEVALQSLLLVAAFYAWVAKGSGKVRLSYVSLILANWAIVRLLNIYKLSDPLWYASLLGGSLLYIAQVEPKLQAANDKEKRHLLRCLATGLICLTASYQSEANLLLGLLTLGFCTGFIFAGLALRIRAFLYVGTITFILQVLRQIWFFIDDYSLLLWGMGIVLGIAFIWIAANFESRREQMLLVLRGWVAEFADWE